jgi:2'-5' RNA ligase
VSLFVAIVPSNQAVEDLQDRLQPVKNDPISASVRWQAPQQWHVTMAFLGDPPDDADDRVARRLDQVAEQFTAPPTLRLAGAGCFGRQILWVGVTGTSDEHHDRFVALEQRIRTGLRADRFVLERRPWHPHLTLGRTRGSDARPVAPLITHYYGPSWAVTELLAVRSEGGPRPRHTVVHRAAFSPPVDVPSG